MPALPMWQEQTGFLSSSRVPAHPMPSLPPSVPMSSFLTVLSLDKVAMPLISEEVQEGHMGVSVLSASWSPNTSLVMDKNSNSVCLIRDDSGVKIRLHVKCLTHWKCPVKY